MDNLDRNELAYIIGIQNDTLNRMVNFINSIQETCSSSVRKKINEFIEKEERKEFGLKELIAGKISLEEYNRVYLSENYNSDDNIDSVEDLDMVSIDSDDDDDENDDGIAEECRDFIVDDDDEEMEEDEVSFSSKNRNIFSFDIDPNSQDSWDR